jgi:hypothetical protein
MNELPGIIPEAQVLLELEPEELTGKILFILRGRSGGKKDASGTISNTDSSISLSVSHALLSARSGVTCLAEL